MLVGVDVAAISRVHALLTRLLVTAGGMFIFQYTLYTLYALYCTANTNGLFFRIKRCPIFGAGWWYSKTNLTVDRALSCIIHQHVLIVCQVEALAYCSTRPPNFQYKKV